MREPNRSGLLLFRCIPVLSFLFVIALLVALTAWPALDMGFSALFAHGAEGFFMRDQPLLNALTKIAFYGSRIMGVFFVLAALGALFFRRSCFGAGAKGWGFLFLCLVIGPGLLANVVFKDHWGRARPRDIEVFGGKRTFTPAFVISDACPRNCSFVSGDASFGFFLPSVAYLFAPARTRRAFWTAFAIGSVFAAARILLGAHFLSDVLAAMLLSLGVSAGLHALLFGRQKTSAFWARWLFLPISRA